VDRTCRFVDETGQLAGGAMAQQRSGTGAQRDRPQQRLTREGTGEGGVDPVEDPLPPPTREMRADHPARDSVLSGLAGRHDTGLVREELAEGHGDDAGVGGVREERTNSSLWISRWWSTGS
jgi:hypothetical protein